MTENDPYIIDSLEELREHYGEPGEMVKKATLNFLHGHMVDFIKRAPFVAISSEAQEGLDVSPRGGTAGCVHVIDRKTVAIGDWPGNNKLETISNIISTGRCALLLLVPTLDLFLRLNGTAVVTKDPLLLKNLIEGNREPKAAIKLSIEQAYFHCGKAFKRSKLWEPEDWNYIDNFPKVGKIMKDLVKVPDMTSEELEEMYQHALKEELY